MESPLVAILSSTGADHRVTSRGFPSIAHLLSPFSTHTLDVKDPIGQSVSAKISVDFRDIRKQGHLLSLSVLPHILQEALSCGSNLEESLSFYSECLQRFAEPSDHETLRNFIACVFVISSGDENPLGELSRLIQLQHTQQHATTENKSIGPSHCATPKWTTPNTLKHYILLHDAARDDEATSTQYFNQMCSTYGVDSCQMLKVGEGSSDGLPDLWGRLDHMDRLLERGLVRALQRAQEGNQNDRKDSLPSSVSTIAPSYVMMQPTSPTALGGGSSLSNAQSTPKLASAADREACAKMIEAFLRNSLIPHAERLMRTLNDQLADRRTIGKSLTSGMKKWFGGGSSPNMAATATSYTPESGEMKSRRLADLAFQFGLYGWAHSQYRAVKKEFENDQAWLYHAAALEMSAVALRVSAPELTAKQFPMRYLEDAMKHMLNGSAKYSCVMRCAINSGRIMAELEQPRDAAMLMSQVSSLDSDHCVGVAQVHAARYFQEAGMERKSAFYYVLAGNRFMKGGVQSVALECYRLALGHYYAKQWDSIEDHLCSILSGQSFDKGLAIDCAARLLRSNPWQSEAEQLRFIDGYAQTLARFGEGTVEVPAELPVPTLCSQDTRVICGERPLSSDVVTETDIPWSTIRRGAFHAVAGSSASFRESSMQLVSDNDTDNRDLRETPPGERFRAIVILENPLVTPLHLKDIHLEVGECSFVEGSHPDSPSITSFETIDRLEMQPGERRQLELSVLPSPEVRSFRISAVAMKVVDSQGREVFGRLPFNLKGKRLNRNAKEMKKVHYAEDHRLAVKVAHRRWPLLDFKVLKPQTDQFYCSQAVKLKVEVNNIGTETVESLVMATDAIDCVFVEAVQGEGQQPCSSKLSVSSNAVRIHSLTSVPIAVSGSQTYLVSLRAPQVECSKSVTLLFFYRCPSGSYREWRMVVDIPTTPLVQAAAKVLDPLKGIVQLDVSNVIPKVADAEIAELDVLKIQAVRHVLNGWEYESVPSGVRLISVNTKSVHLDNGQSASICFTAAGTRSTHQAEDFFWLDQPVDYPKWPLPQPPDQESPPAAERMISVLWRCSIVDQGGFKSIVTGEIFLPCPFRAVSFVIPGMEQSDYVEGENGHSPIAVSCPSLDVLRHDFSSNRLCLLPLKFHVYNQDPSQRAASVTVSFVPKVSDAVGAVSQVAPESRQLWWPDRLVTRATIPAGQEHTFTFSIRVTQPSVFELGGGNFRIDGLFADTKQTIALPTPSILAIVNSV